MRMAPQWGSRAQPSTGQRVEDEVLIAYDEGSVDEDVDDARRRTRALPVAGLIADPVVVEHDHVGVGARSQAPLVAHRRDTSLQNPRREERATAEGVGERHPLLPPQAQRTGEASCGARMSDRRRW